VVKRTNLDRVETGQPISKNRTLNFDRQPIPLVTPFPRSIIKVLESETVYGVEPRRFQNPVTKRDKLGLFS
jgi:hypothetical protein